MNKTMGLKKYIGRLLLLICLVAPSILVAQRAPWRRTVQLQDRRDGGQTPVVANVTFQAYWMKDRVSPGSPILAVDGKPDPIKFDNRPDGFIKFKIVEINWAPLGATYDGSSDYKVVVRSVWVDMIPRIYLDRAVPGRSKAALQKMFITAPNVEYVKNDSLPPPIIFKVDRNDKYTFSIGIKATTPKTALEKPFDFNFSFDVTGLLRSNIVEEEIVEEVPKAPVEVVKKDTVINTDDIDNAVARAIEEERVDDLIQLIKDNPKVESARKARSQLALKMTKELVDSTTYRVDISYAKFTKTTPSKEQVNLAFSRFGTVLGNGNEPYHVWRDGKLFVRPPQDSIDYIVSAIHRTAPENKASISLNSLKDYINFSYRDTLDNDVAVSVTGGHGPYTLFIQQRNGDDFFDVEGSMRIAGDTVLNKERMARQFRIAEEADYRMFIVDDEQLKKSGSGLVHLIPPPPIPPFVWYIAGGLLIAFFFGFLLYKRDQRKKDEEMETLLAARGGADPKVKRKPKPELTNFWKETAIRDLSLHKNFIREITTYLRERPHRDSDAPMIEGVILGTVLKFDFESEQYEVRLDRFRAMDAKPLDYYDEKGDHEKWSDIKEIANQHKDLVKIGWLQVAEGRPMRLSKLEQEFQDEQFSELFQLLLKIDIIEGQKYCGFFTRTIGGKMNDAKDRKDDVNYWLNWDQLEDAGYYESSNKAVSDGGKIKVKLKGQETA